MVKEAAPIMIDVGTRLKVDLVGIKGRLDCNLVGLKPNEYFIFDMPPKIFQEELKIGQEAIVRYLYFGNIFGFRTELMKIMEKPFNLLFFSYPTAVEMHNLRKDTRIQCHIPGTITVKKTDLRGVITDISISGCQFMTKSYSENIENLIKTKEIVNLVFPFFGMEGLQTSKATVRHLSINQENTSLGLAFDSLGKNISKKLQIYIENVNKKTL